MLLLDPYQQFSGPTCIDSAKFEAKYMPYTDAVHAGHCKPLGIFDILRFGPSYQMCTACVRQQASAPRDRFGLSSIAAGA